MKKGVNTSENTCEFVRGKYQVGLLRKKDNLVHTAQKMKFSIKDFFSNCDQIRSSLRIWSHLLKKTIMENFIFCAVIFIYGPV